MCRSAFEAWQADQAREDGPRGRCGAWGAPQNKRKFAKDLGDIFQGSLAPSALVTVCAYVVSAQERELRSVQRFGGDQGVPRPRCGTQNIAIVPIISRQ